MQDSNNFSAIYLPDKSMDLDRILLAAEIW